MANNYLEFSEAIDDLTEDEKRWWENEQLLVQERMDKDGEDGYDAWSDERNCQDFDIEGDSIWFHADESGDVEKVADIVQRFFKGFRPHAIFTLTWAAYCSKPRIGEFHGGAVVVTADEVIMESSGEWVFRMKRDLESKGYGV